MVKKPLPELTTEEIKDVLGQLVKMGTFVVKFSGGDIFLRKDVFEIIRCASRKKFQIGILTNATLITEKTARRLKKENVSFVMVSIYGSTPKTHESITGTPGSFEKMMRGVNYLKEEKIFTYFVCPLTNLNSSGYERLTETVQSRGHEIFLNPLILRKRNTADTGLNLSEGQLRRFCQTSTGSEWLKILNVDGRSKMLRNERLRQPLCDGGRVVAVISPYGEVLPCYFFPQSAGNIRKESFKEIWYNAPLFKFLGDLKMKDVRKCSECEYLSYCTYCPALSVAEKGCVLLPSDFVCKQARILAGLHKDEKFRNKAADTIPTGGMKNTQAFLDGR